MNNQPNWNKIKQALKENIIEIDFKKHITTTFIGIDFDKGIEIFRYLMELKLPNYDEAKSVFSKLEDYSNGNLNKEILNELITNYEPFLKKLYEIIGIPYSPNTTRPSGPALSWCYNNLFNKLSIPQNPQLSEFYNKTLNGKIENPTFQSSHFSSGFLSDSTQFGKDLHSSYYLRNSKIHNDTPLTVRNISDYTTDLLNSYFYFVFKYYAELCSAIPQVDLLPPSTLIIKNLASLSGGAYNPDIENEVKRENIIQTIESKLQDLDVLFIEGEDGIGKTTILHQFIEKYPNYCFAYFIDGNDSNTYSNLAILKAFCNQLHFINKERELEEDVDVNSYTNEDWLKDYLSTEKIRNRSNSTCYFIIDGLDEVIQDRQKEIKEYILDKISYEKAGIKLILSGKQNRNLIKSSCRYDKYDITYLLEQDSLKIFGNSITPEQFIDINKVCKNNAGKIVFFRDLIKKLKIDIDIITDKLSSDLKGLYEYLWNNITEIEENQKIILAIIAFDDEKYDIKKISKVLNISEREVISLLQSIPLVKKNSRGTYEFIFDGFVDFIKTKLSTYRLKIDKIVIEYLLNNLDSPDSLVRLPEIYNKTGKKDDLLKLLSNERWNQLLIATEKISVVSRVSGYTLETIQDEVENKYIPSILKYSVLKSALKELNRSTVWQYEIAASLVLEDYIGAENLANIAFLKEDRLKMYASIAKAYIEKKEKVPFEIHRKIEVLFEDIDTKKDFKNIKESAVEIASLLMYSNPKLAFKLIEDLAGDITNNDNAFDWALAQISLSVHSNLEKLEDVSKEDINTKVYSKIRNPKIKEFTDAILYLSENQTSEQIIEKIQQLESTSQKMFLIRNWISNNKEDNKVDDVIELGLRLVVDKSDKYVPKSGDYKIFALPLPYLKDKAKVYDFIEKIEQYTISIEANSATIDLLTIKLFIVRSICNFEFEKGEEKLLDIFTEIDDLCDLALKCTCLAIYANEATKIVNIHQDKNLDMYLDTARENIKGNIDKILEQTASHFEIVQSIITNLVRLYPNESINICKKLNKSIDRDNAFLESLSTYLSQKIDKIELNIVDELLNSIADIDIQKIAISEIVNRLERIEENTNTDVSKYFKYFDRVDNLFDNRAKCILYVKIISIFEQNDKDCESFSNKLQSTWTELEESVYKIELGYEIAYNAAFLKDRNLAKKILQLAKKEKEEPSLLLDSPSTTTVFASIIEILIRLFSGLVVKNLYQKEDIENIDRIISSLPSERQQMNLWSSLILLVKRKSSQNESLIKTLINSYIIPKLSKIRNKNERIDTIIDIIVALYFNDKSLPNLEELPSSKLQDVALSKICKYLFSKCLPEELCNDNNEGYNVDYDTIKNILEITNRMSNDYFIASQIIEIRKSVLSKNTKVSLQQRIDIKREFEKIATNKLPDKNNIRHNGYKILVKANALAIQSKSKWEEWSIILQEIENIPNLSDKIFMWDSVAELLPDEFSKHKRELIEKAVDSTYKLPSFLDTVGRIEMIFYTLYKKSIAGVGLRTLLEDFIKVINNNPHSPFLRENYKSILDVAFSIDPIIAKALVNSFDKDVARLNTGTYLNNHLNLIEFQSKLEKKVEGKKTERQLLEENNQYFFDVINKKLAKLNASKIPNDGYYPKDLVYQLKIASEYSIYKSQNAFYYFIERLNIFYQNTNEAQKLIRKSFMELVDVCNLVKLLSIRNAEKIKSLLDVLNFNNEDINDGKDKVDDETYSTIINLLKKGKTAKEIASFLEIDVELINSIETIA